MLELTRALSFVRYGGTEEELQAAKILQSEIRQAGGESRLMEFSIPAPVPGVSRISVISPYEKELPCIPYGMSGCLPEGGADLKLRYLERGSEMDYLGLDDLSDSVVMVNDLRLEVYKLLVEKKAAAFMVINGKYYDTMESASMYEKNLRPRFLEEGKIPGFMIPAAEAMELVQKQAAVLHLELQQGETEHTSRNIIAEIPGTDPAGETVVLTAHYDSVPLGTGSWDNATGSTALMELYKRFLKVPVRRNLRFLWCGSEEQGLLGSKAYVEANEEALKEIKFCFNFDMCGTALGPNEIFVTGTKELETFVSQFLREVGYSADLHICVHSSDSAPFCDKGIPALGLSRGTRTAEIHTRRDLMFPLDEQAIVRNVNFAEAIIRRVADAVVIPVPMGMSDEMKTELDKYFQRDKKDEEKK